MGGVSRIYELPQELIEEIVSRTSPHACGTLSVVSKKIGSAANSDHVWERFLPIDIISRRANKRWFNDNYPWRKIHLDTLHAFATKKDLYLFLSDNPLIIDDGAMCLWMDKLSGNKCYLIGPPKLIKSDSTNWRFYARHTRFGDINTPVFFAGMNFEVEGKISTSLLSPNTHYTAYLLFSFFEYYFYGYGAEEPLETWVGIDGHGENRNVYIPKKDDIPVLSTPQYPVQRHDGWYEVELGDYLNKELGVDSSELRFSLREVKSWIRRGGIHLHGIEMRPKSSRKLNWI